MNDDSTTGKNVGDAALTVDILKYLSSTHRAEFQSRKKFEWRVFFTVPMAFAVITAGVWSNNATINQGLETLSAWFVWIVFIITALITCVLLYFLHLSHEVNKSAAHPAELHLQAIYNQISGLETEQPLSALKMFSERSPVIKFENPHKSIKAGPWGFISEGLIILIIAGVCACLIQIKLNNLNKKAASTKPVPAVFNRPLKG